MTKAELIAAIAESTSLTRAEVDRALGAFTEVVTSALKGGDKVTIVGFGTFSVSRRESRVGRNPRTGQQITIPAKATPRFKASKSLDEAVGSAS
ncbi:HU family DNA-binding protein [Myxococcota bacterium]|nr:HU family DNA-binding protein [Myxococcota bacterium]